MKSNDERLKYIMQLANGCCNHFAKSPKKIKEIFYEAVTFYNFFFDETNNVEKPLSELEKETLNDLYCLIKVLASANSTQIKYRHIDEQWDFVKKESHRLARIRLGQEQEQS